MRPAASGFGFGGAAGCAGAPPEGNAAQSVRSESDRSFGFWPRTTSRGKACADEAAQAVASLCDLIFEVTAQRATFCVPLSGESPLLQQRELHFSAAAKLCE